MKVNGHSLYERRDDKFECNTCGLVFDSIEDIPFCTGKKNPLRHLMLDLETLGTCSQAVITQIGACYFNMDGDTGETFSANIQIQDCLNHGLKVNGNTIMWWFEQPEELRTWLKEPQPLITVLENFKQYAKNAKYIWSHATFDVPILLNAYLAIDSQPPFNYRAARDLRTLTWLRGGSYKKVERENRHDALSDCIYQIKYATKCYQEIKNAVKNTKNTSK